METIVLRGLVEGYACGELLVYDSPLSFYGEVDEYGRIMGKVEISRKILVFKYPRGSTVGSYVLYGLSRRGLAPSGIIVISADPILVAGAVMAEIPLAEGITEEVFHELRKENGNYFCLEVVPPRAVLRKQ